MNNWKNAIEKKKKDIIELDITKSMPIKEVLSNKEREPIFTPSVRTDVDVFQKPVYKNEIQRSPSELGQEALMYAMDILNGKDIDDEKPNMVDMVFDARKPEINPIKAFENGNKAVQLSMPQIELFASLTDTKNIDTLNSKQALTMLATQIDQLEHEAAFNSVADRAVEEKNLADIDLLAQMQNKLTLWQEEADRQNVQNRANTMPLPYVANINKTAGQPEQNAFSLKNSVVPIKYDEFGVPMPIPEEERNNKTLKWQFNETIAETIAKGSNVLGKAGNSVLNSIASLPAYNPYLNNDTGLYYTNAENYIFNKEIKDGYGLGVMINGQGVTEGIKDLRVGANNTAGNGCGWIATYNALQLLGKYQPPAEIIKELDEMGGLRVNGNFGYNAQAITNYLNNHECNATYHTTPPESFNGILKNNNVVILQYTWANERKIGGHYVTVTYDPRKDGYIIYNLDDEPPTEVFETSIDEWIENEGYVMSYIIVN